MSVCLSVCSAVCVCVCGQDYESRILTLQEQLERHSLMSSMTPDDFDVDYDDFLGIYDSCATVSTIGTAL